MKKFVLGMGSHGWRSLRLFKTMKLLAMFLVLGLAQFARGAIYELDCGAAAEAGFGSRLSVGDTLALKLPDGVRFNVELVEKSPSKIGGEAFMGRVEGAGGLLTAAVVKGAGGLKVTFTSPADGQTYLVQSTARGTRVRKVDPADYIRKPSPSLVPAFKPSAERKSRALLQAQSVGPVTVDILVAYDLGAKDWLDGEGQDAETFAQSAVTRMNSALANTGLTSSFRFRLVGTLAVNARSTSLNEALYAVTDKEGAWSVVAGYRDEVGADIVTTLIDIGDGDGMTGLGWSLQDELKLGDYSWFADSAYNVCSIRAVEIGHTMTHEVGHNMGAGHSDIQAVSPGPQLFSYSSGYYFTANGKSYHTIMAYDTDGYSDVHYIEVPYFSSPLHSYDGVAVGDSIHDNSLTLKNTFGQVAAFRAAKIDPIVDPDPEPDLSPLTWYTTKAQAFAAAQASGKRILLVYGRDECGNTTATRNYTCEDSAVKAKLNAGYVLWYSNCDTQWGESDRYLKNFGGTLPGVSVIDTALDRAIVGTGGYQNVSNLLSLLAAAEAYVPPEPPANDNFAKAAELTGDSGFVTATNAEATCEPGEPLLRSFPTATTTVWWKWTAPASGKVAFYTIGSGFDTIMGIYQGGALSSLTEVSVDDDGGDGTTSKCTFDCSAGATYYVCIGGYELEAGGICLQWELVAPPLTWYTTKAEAFAAAQASGKRILLIYGRDECSNTTAARNYTCEDPAVKAKLNAGYVLWYSNCDTQWEESDRYLKNFGGILPGVSVIDPVLDRAIVGAGGYQNVSDMLSLLVEAEKYVLPANDNFAKATVLTGASGSVTATNAEATSESGEPLLRSFPTATTTVWWKWTAPASGKVAFYTIGSGFDTIMGIYQGGALSSLTEVSVDDDGGDGTTSKSQFNCRAGTSYYICIGGFGAACGEIRLQWLLTEIVGPDFNFLELFPDESTGGDARMPYEDAAGVYDGYIRDADGNVAGTIQVTVSKGKVDKKTGAFSAKTKATVQLADGSKKISFKGGVADQFGNVTGLTAAGHRLEVALGVGGLGGTVDGRSVDGARNFFSAKDAAAKALASAAERAWVGAIGVVADKVELSVVVAKKGKVKISGTVAGEKVSVKSQLLVGDDACCIPVVSAKKAKLALNLWLMPDGSVEVAGLDGAAAGRSRALRAGAKFALGGDASILPGVFGEYLPNGLAVADNGGKWVVAGGAKAGKPKLAKGTDAIDPAKSKFTGNMSGLKLSCKAKDGTFKGSFKAYALENGKLKSYTVNVTGVMVGDVGYGTATIKKPAVSWPVTVR